MMMLWSICGPPLKGEFLTMDINQLIVMLAGRLIRLQGEYKICTFQLFSIPASEMAESKEQYIMAKYIIKWARMLEQLQTEREHLFENHSLLKWERGSGITLVSGRFAELDEMERKTGCKMYIDLGATWGPSTEIEQQTGIKSDAGEWAADWQKYLLLIK